MVKLQKYLLGYVVVIVALCGYSFSRVKKIDNFKPAGARLSTAEAIQIAKQLAEQKGLRLSDYQEPDAHFEVTVKDKSWSVFFDGNSGIVGGHFSVFIDDPSGKATFVGGL